MPRYRVHGIDHETGLETELVVEAAHHGFARRAASAQGIDPLRVNEVLEHPERWTDRFNDWFQDFSWRSDAWLGAGIKRLAVWPPVIALAVAGVVTLRNGLMIDGQAESVMHQIYAALWYLTAAVLFVGFVVAALLAALVLRKDS